MHPALSLLLRRQTNTKPMDGTLEALSGLARVNDPVHHCLTACLDAKWPSALTARMTLHGHIRGRHGDAMDNRSPEARKLKRLRGLDRKSRETGREGCIWWACS